VLHLSRVTSGLAGLWE